MNFTSEQLKAIEARGTNILLSAAAGSGKTAVLVERVLRLILDDGADVDRMLIMTFTKAAASDMRRKLQKALTERAKEDTRCRRQLDKLDRAHISTLHAFCADFLREHFEAARVDPSFAILDAPTADRMRSDAIDDAIDAAYADYDETMRLLDFGRRPKGVREIIDTVMNAMESRPDPEAWLKRNTTDAEKLICNYIAPIEKAARSKLRTAIVHLNRLRDVPGYPTDYEEIYDNDAAMIRELIDTEDTAELYAALDISFKTLPRVKDALYPGKAAAQELRKKAKDAVKAAREKLALIIDPEMTRDIRSLIPELERVAEIVLDATARFEAAKAENAVLTYNDLEHKTLEALRDPDAANAMRETYDYIFIDEYQDTSDLQETMVNAIARENNRFAVGDVKQSIYRFRNAVPELFLDKYAKYGKGEGGLLLPLTSNFRSDAGVLDFINMIFERVMIGGDTEILYDENARLNHGLPDADRYADPVELHLFVNPQKESTGDAAEEAIEEVKGAEREAYFIAERIRALRAEDATLDYSDIAILCRKKAGFAVMQRVLTEAGIPAYADGTGGLYDSIEMSWLMSLLRLVLNRRLDVELVAVLYSPMVGLTADELAQIRIASPRLPFTDAAVKFAQGESSTAKKVAAFFDMMKRWRLLMQTMSLGEFIRLLLEESGFYIYAGALADGEQRQANLDRFIGEACVFDTTHNGSLLRFLDNVEYMKQKGGAEIASRLTANDKVVRLMSIHKSKGLEFRIVFGVGLSGAYRLAKKTETETDKDLGIAIPYFDAETRTRRTTLAQAAMSEYQKMKDRAEELRLLYVLLTRARQKLILCGTIKKRWEESEEGFHALAGLPMECSNHLAVILSAYEDAKHRGAPTCATVIEHAELPIRKESDAARPALAQFDAIVEAPDDYRDAEIDRAMRWQYPYPNDTTKPLKLTVSALAHELQGPQVIRPLMSRPLFMQTEEKKLTGAERGTAMHLALQLLDLKALRGLDGEALSEAAGAQLDAAAEANRMTWAQRESVRMDRLVNFLCSEVGRRMLSAETLRREWPFNFKMRVGDALTTAEADRYADEEFLVQGTVDCCFMEDGEWVLLDYKTDTESQWLARRESYEHQLRMYTRALESITGIHVKESLLCLLSMNTQVSI